MLVYGVVVYCMLYSATTCRQVEIVPANVGQEPTAHGCMWGGMAGNSAPFLFNGDWWVFKGVRCSPAAPDVAAVGKWVEAEKARLKRMEPQIR